MLESLFLFIHETLGMCFWTPFALIATIIAVVVAGVHTYKQKKREKEFQNGGTDKKSPVMAEI